MKESQIDRSLLRVFHKIKQYQTSTLYRYFEQGLSHYIAFLLGFALRNPEIMKSKIVRTISLTEMIRLIDEDPNSQITKGEDTNDVELIPL
jgi:hypothetical protein